MWSRRLPAAGLEARLTNTPQSNPSPSQRVVQARQLVTPLSAASDGKTRVHCTSGDIKPVKHGAVARQKGLDHGPETPAAEAAARPPSTARQPVPGQCVEEAPSSAESSRPPSGSRSSRRKKAQQAKLASAQSNAFAHKPASVSHNTGSPVDRHASYQWAPVCCQHLDRIFPRSCHLRPQLTSCQNQHGLPGEAVDKAHSADLGMLQTQPLPSSVLLDAADVPRPSARQGMSLLGLAGAADGQCSDESPSHDFRLHRQPHRWSPTPTENGHGASTAAATDRAAHSASAPGQASSALWPGVPGGQGTEARPQSRAARTLPMSPQPAAGAAAEPALAGSRHTAAAAAAAAAVVASAPEAGTQAKSLSKQAAGAPGTDSPRPPEQREPAPQLQGYPPACTQPISAAPADGGRIRAVHLAAQLHACVLGSCATLAVLTELELLVQLMTLPLHCKQGPSSSSAAHARTWDWQILSSPEDAAAYSCLTLEHCGELSALSQPSISSTTVPFHSSIIC